ncbi:MAG TPA: hypothetical protein VL283_01545 [Candidatus Baltobacteraceae bacterium]|jgi:hypothetical protein|nr:hypothetical protein [Candidatus Baltobacteraceae bacterium]
MHLLAVRLAALLSLAALRLGKARIPLWGYHFALWRLRLDHPDPMRDFPPIPPFHPMYASWTFQPIATSMAILGDRVRLDSAGEILELSSIDAKRTLKHMTTLGWQAEIEAVRPLVAPFIAWSQPLRKDALMPKEKADAYADILVAVFSLAAVNHGHERTRVADFHCLMVALRAEFPNDMPSFDEVGKPPFQSSELLSDALHRALYADPPRIVTDARANLVVERTAAMRNMNGFDAFTRARFVKTYSKVAERFVALQRAEDDGPPPLKGA